MSKHFTLNILLLSASGLFMKGLGIAFTAFLSGVISPETLGLFSLVMSVYSMAMTFAYSGMSLAVTRIVSEETVKDKNRARGALRLSLLFAIAFGIFAACLLFFIAAPSGRFLGDERIVPALKLISPGLLFVALTNVQGGYFTAVRRVKKGIFTAVFEQIFRIFISLLFIRFSGDGETDICLSICFAGMLSEIFAFAVSHTLFVRDIKAHRLELGSDKSIFVHKRKILSICLPVALSSYLRSGLSTLRNLIIPKCLMFFGFSKSRALEEFAYVTSMSMPIILFPSTIVYSFASLIVPELASMKERGDEERISRIAATVLEKSVRFSSIVFALFFIFGNQLGVLFYSSENAGVYIRILSPLVITIYLDAAVDGMLKGLNQQAYSMLLNLAEALISLAGVYLLLPRFGMKGYIITLYVCEIFNTSFSVLRLTRVAALSNAFISSLFFFSAVALASALAAKYILFLFFGVNQGAIPIFLSMLSAVFIFAAFLRLKSFGGLKNYLKKNKRKSALRRLF